MLIVLNKLIKNNFLSKSNNCIVSVMKYGSERKKMPHVAKTKEVWVKSSNKIKEIKSKEVVDEKFMSRKIVDPVWVASEYPPQYYNFGTIVNFHKELAQESIFNNLNGFITAKFLLDMRTKKKGKFLDSVKFNVKYPHDFVDGIKKEVIAICKSDKEISEAKDAGALYAGHTELLKKFERGDITDASYDIIVCTPETLPDFNIVKKKINKDRLPSLKSNTIGENIGELVNFFRSSKTYESLKINDEKAILKANFGLLNMDTEKLHENLKELIKITLTQGKLDTESFIINCSIFSAPSTEAFLIDLSEYIKQEINEDAEEQDIQIKKEKV